MNDTIVEIVPAPITEETWLNHFQSLHSNDPRTSTQQQEIYNEWQSLEKEKEQHNSLDHTITEQEIRQAVKKLEMKWSKRALNHLCLFISNFSILFCSLGKCQIFGVKALQLRTNRLIRVTQQTIEAYVYLAALENCLAPF